MLRVSNPSLQSERRSYLPLVMVLLFFRLTVQAQAVRSHENGATEYSLEGTVINSVTGEPIRRVLVEVVADSVQAKLTDSDGHFRFDGMPPMRVSVSLTKPGFFNQDEVPLDPSAQAQIHLGSQQQEMVLKMTPESLVVGRVANINGAPLEGIPVKLKCVRVANGHRAAQRCGNAFTDEDGQFRFGELTPGSYYVEAGPSPNYRMTPDSGSTEPAERYVAVFYPGTAGIDSATPLELAAGQQMEADFFLQPEPESASPSSANRYAASVTGPELLPVAATQGTLRISGTVVNAITGQPVRGAKVGVALSPNTAVPRTVTADESGHFAFAGLMHGTYVFSVESRGFVPLGHAPATADGIEVKAGADLDNLILRLRPDASLSGIITDDQNEALRGAQVMLFRSVVEGGKRRIRLQSQLSTDEAGHYRFSHLLPGTYSVAVTAVPWYAQYRHAAWGSSLTSAGADPASAQDLDLDVAYPITFYSGSTASSDFSSAVALHLGSGDRLEADVTLRSVPALHLLVRNASADPSWSGSATLMESMCDGFAAQVPAQETTINGSLIEITGVAPGHYLVRLQAYGGQRTAMRSRLLDVPSDMEIDGNQI
jgi:hypothetical protein